MPDGGGQGGQTLATTCPYCGVGCGLLVTVDSTGAVGVRGDPLHPANRGRLCSKGAALADTIDLPGRLLYPQVRGRRASWETALDAVAGGFKRIVEEHGPDAVAFYVSGQLLTEDYYVANKLMKGFIGTANIDTNSRLCMSSAVAAHKRAFGSDTVPVCYDDIEAADLIVLVGSNTAWCHPVVYQRIVATRQRRPETRVVVIDPRRTPTCDIADVHLPLRPGTDVILFNGLLSYLSEHGVLDFDFLEHHAEGFAAAVAAAREPAATVAQVAGLCDLAEEAVLNFYRLFAAHDRVLTVYSQGVNQSSSGTDKANSIINCHLATGRVGRVGAGPFSITGQPNAMGGREVGGLANQLAAHMDFDDEAVRRVAGFWQAPRMATRPGLKAVDLFHAVESGAVKAVWIMATNPAVSLPEADRVRRALERCELVVVSDCVGDTDTTACADILLPAAGWGEKEGTVTNSERCISRQRAFRRAPGEARPDWKIVCDVAQRLGFGRQFDYRDAAAIFREHAQLSGWENSGSRDFDISGLSGIDDREYEALTPVQWPVRSGGGGTARMFEGRRFFTPSGKARFVAVQPRPPARLPDHDFPLVLNTGRVRDQWHTMTRTGAASRLTAHSAEPFIEVHPLDAQGRNLRSGEIATIASRWGTMLARIVLSTAQKPGTVFAPIHWSDRFATLGRVGAVVEGATDPISGQPESKFTPVRVLPFAVRWYGFVLSRSELNGFGAAYCIRVREKLCWRYELADPEEPGDWSVWARERLGKSGDWVDFEDRAAGYFRSARLIDGRLESCVFVARSPTLPPRSWLLGLFGQARLAEEERAGLLSARAGPGRRDVGTTVCSCFGVNSEAIIDAVRNRGLTTPEAIGNFLKAGTNCGSCIPELKGLIAASLSTNS